MIRHTTFDYHHGQSDERLYVTDNGNLSAYLDYSVYEGEPSIKYIHTEEDKRGEGLGKKLIIALQKLYPETEINWGLMTDDGARLKHSLKFRKIIDPVLQKKEELLKRVKTKLADLEANPENNIRHFGDYWNRLYDLERRLDAELYQAKIVKHIVEY